MAFSLSVGVPTSVEASEPEEDSETEMTVVLGYLGEGVTVSRKPSPLFHVAWPRSRLTQPIIAIVSCQMGMKNLGRDALHL